MKTLLEQFINTKFNETVSYLSGDDMTESEAGFYFMMGWDGNKGMPTASVVIEDANKYVFFLCAVFSGDRSHAQEK